MKHGFFLKVAWGNIKKNYRFFIPRILAETGLTACFYITATLYGDKRIAQVRGGELVSTFMMFGTVILGLLSLILLLYTNSFLMKQRRREFGLYNVLGMEKRHVGRVLFRENMLCAFLSVTLGLGLGILFYKLCSLLICKLLQAESILGFYYVRAGSVLATAAFFLMTDLVICLIDRVSVARMRPVELLTSGQSGEREPKVKWPLLVLGSLCLGAGYGIAVNAGDALEAVAWFFPAVFLVIFGTYFLFVSGSIFILKALKRNKRYYYNKRHFVTLSGLIYRMKQNAVGLASIAILATGVLVMISTTVSLYTGMGESLAHNYPQQLYLSASYAPADDTAVADMEQLPAEALERIVRDAAAENGLTVSKTEAQPYLEVAFLRDGALLVTDRDASGAGAGRITDFTFITEDTYVSLGGEPLGLTGNDIAVYAMDGTRPIAQDHLELNGERFDIAGRAPAFTVNANMVSGVDAFGAVVADEAALEHLYDIQARAYGKNASIMELRLAVDFTDAEAAAGKDAELRHSIINGIDAFAGLVAAHYSCNIETREGGRESLVGMYGTFLFLGIILGAVCLFATALIVYYKQISEGYEDRGRFQIMKKVGMSDGEIRRSVRKQIVWVFFLPLGVAGVHLCFAFPMLEKMLRLFMLPETAVFVRCTVAVFLVFALVYVIIYSGTSKTYYKIVR